MQDIDLPLKEECGTCFGHGFLVYDYGSMAPIKNVPCEICDGEGYVKYEELELE